MADGAWYFYACHLCDELDKTARDADGVDDVNSIGFLWFSRSRFLGASAVRRASLSFLLACLVGDVVSSSVFGVASVCPIVDTRPVIRLSCVIVPLLAALPFAPSLVSYRFAPLPAPSLVSSSGAMSFCGRGLLAFLVRAMWYQIGGGSVLLASCHR